MSFRMGVLGLMVSALVVSSAGGARADFVYGIDDNRVIWEFDTVAQSQQAIYDTGLAAGLPNSLAYDSVRDQLMFRNPGTPGNQSALYVWDRVGSVQTLATAAQLGNYDSASAAYFNNAYYFFDDGSSKLVQVNLNYTGSTPSFGSKVEYTVNNPGASLAFGDIAIDANTGTLYGATVDGRFFSLDLNSPTSSYNLIKSGNTSLQLAFSADYSTLYGHSFNTGQWYTLNTATGVATAVAGFVTTEMRDLGGSAATPFNPVPEPSSILMLGIGGASLLVLRRRVRRVVQG